MCADLHSTGNDSPIKAPDFNLYHQQIVCAASVRSFDPLNSIGRYSQIQSLVDATYLVFCTPDRKNRHRIRMQTQFKSLELQSPKFPPPVSPGMVAERMSEHTWQTCWVDMCLDSVWHWCTVPWDSQGATRKKLELASGSILQ